MKIALGSIAFVALGIFLILVSLPGQLYVLTLIGAACVLGAPVVGLCVALLKAMPSGQYPPPLTQPTPNRPTGCGFGGRVHNVGIGHPALPQYQGKCDCGNWVGPVRTTESWAFQDLSAHSYG
jgi:hypothetical protein